MAIKKHVFISTTGTLLPEWQQAFGKALAVSPDRALPKADLYWLRLQDSVTVTQQVQDLLAAAQPAPSTVIVLSDIPNDDEALAAFSAGARGYANAHAGSETLKQIAKVVTEGGLWIGESLMRRLMQGVQQIPAVKPASSEQSKLTLREIEVAKAIASGASNKEVARLLNITERTVKAHVSGLFTKLAVQDRLQLALKIRDML